MHREEALQDEIDGLASLEFVGEGEARRAINVNEGCAVSFIEGVLFKHSVRGHADEVQAKTALLRLYLLFEDNTITLKEILQRIEKKAKAIQNKGIVDTWAHVVENMMTKLAETFSKLGTWAADHREPTEKNGYVQWKHNCVPAIRSLCGEITAHAGHRADDVREGWSAVLPHEPTCIHPETVGRVWTPQEDDTSA